MNELSLSQAGSRFNSLAIQRWVLAGLIGVASLAVAQQRLHFRDKAGNMELRDFTGGWKISRVEGTENKFKFRAAGKPLTAIWESQGITAKTAVLQGTAIRGEDQRL